MRTGEKGYVSLGTQLAEHLLDFNTSLSTNDANTKRQNSRKKLSISQHRDSNHPVSHAPVRLVSLVELQPIIVSPRFIFQIPDSPLHGTSTHAYLISDVVFANCDKLLYSLLPALRIHLLILGHARPMTKQLTAAKTPTRLMMASLDHGALVRAVGDRSCGVSARGTS